MPIISVRDNEKKQMKEKHKQTNKQKNKDRKEQGGQKL